MIGVRFLTDYVQRIVQVSVVGDFVVGLNYYVTSMLLAFFSIAVSSKQYFGSQIQSWEHAREDHISYYRWVPIMLALQALCFFIPNWMWSAVHRHTTIMPEVFISAAVKCKNMHGEDRNAELKTIAKSMHGAIKAFRREKVSLSTGETATVAYLATKFAFLVIVAIQFFLMNYFLGGTYLNWCSTTIGAILHGNEWNESPIFPRVMANIQRHTVQCVLMLNMINEKIYLFLFAWFIFIGVSTAINFLYNLAIVVLRPMAISSIVSQLDEDVVSSCPARHTTKFVKKYLRADGVLLLRFIGSNAGDGIARELLNELFVMFKAENSNERAVV
uniref:Innexin n=1 Tax=Steinernema glaseri TaxID=37863 RepID=A0A1I8ARD4_9BILA